MRKLIYPALFFGLAVFVFFWYLQPTYTEIQSLREEISQYNNTLSQVNQLQDELNEKLQRRDAIESDHFNRLNRMLPETVDTVRFLIELDQIAARHGMSVQDVSFSGAPAQFGGSGGANNQEESESNYNTVTASFSVTGSYTAVQDFMRDIERSSRLMDITNFSLSTGEAGSDSGLSDTNQYSFSLQTYWRNSNSS